MNNFFILSGLTVEQKAGLKVLIRPNPKQNQTKTPTENQPFAPPNERQSKVIKKLNLSAPIREKKRPFIVKSPHDNHRHITCKKACTLFSTGSYQQFVSSLRQTALSCLIKLIFNGLFHKFHMRIA